MPQGVFLPYTGVKTNIIYCIKAKENIKQNHFWYFDVKNDGFTLDNHRIRKDGNNDIDNFLAHRNIETYNQNKLFEIGFNIVDIKEVEKCDYILSGNKYKKIISTSNSDFEFVELNEVCQFYRGITFSKNDQVYTESDNTIRIASTKACQENGIDEQELYFIPSKLVQDEDKIIKRNDILISLANSVDLVGRVSFVPNINYRASFGAFMGLIRPNENKILPLFLFYILKSQPAKQFYLNNARTTTNISNLNFSILSNLKIPLPSIEVQQKFVNELLSYKQIISGSNLVVSNYKPSFEIKSSWKSFKLGDIATLKYGFTTNAIETGDYRYIRITDINEKNQLSNDAPKFVKFSKEMSEFVINKGDLLIARTGATFGKCLYIEEKLKAIFASYLIKVTFNNSLLPKFFWYFSQTTEYWQQANQLVSGTGQPQFNANAIKEMIVPVPSIKEQQSIILEIEKEQNMIYPNYQIIDYYNTKFEKCLKDIWGI